MKLLITAGHNWWVVMPNFVIHEPSRGENLTEEAIVGPEEPKRAHGLPRPRLERRAK